jgi:hypothetical protein
MEKIWNWIVDHALGEVSVIKGAPIAFLCCVLITVPITYSGASWRYSVLRTKSANLALQLNNLAQGTNCTVAEKAKVCNFDS